MIKVLIARANIKTFDSFCVKPDINLLAPLSFSLSSSLKFARTSVSTARVASRASAAMTSAWEAAPSRAMPVAVWPAGTSSTGAAVWRSVLLDTMSSGAGDVSAFPSARWVIIDGVKCQDIQSGRSNQGPIMIMGGWIN